jgi:hypothetical protein
MKSVLAVLKRIMDVTDQEVTDAIQTWNTENNTIFYELSIWEKGIALQKIIEIIKKNRVEIA